MSVSASVLVFCARDAEAFSEAAALARDVGARFIDKLSSDISELQLVVRYKVVEPVVVLVLAGSTVVARIPRLVSADELRMTMAWLGRG